MLLTTRRFLSTATFHTMVFLLAACGGGAGDDAPNNGNQGLAEYSKPDRYAETAYSDFVSANSTSNLEGTWVVLMDGVLKEGNTPVVNGRNDAVEYQYYARALLRLRKPDPTTDSYFIYTCGPGGARDHSTTSNGVTIFIPFYYYSTGNFTSYSMSIVDAATMKNNSVTREWGWIGNSGLAISYNLDFTIKKISDDPFANVSELTDLDTSKITQNGCFYEAEGNYLATQDDQYVQGFRKEGTFYNASAFPVSEMVSDLSSYSISFELNKFSDYFTSFNRYRETIDSIQYYDNYRNQENDTVDATRMVTGNTARYTVNASEYLNASNSISLMLDLNLE